ncbi:hypothetical protein E1A91_A13G014800v1 [Gossypium mustelinum]|uniref:Ataxin-2 C-terminal domain-containing protein n=1 Tax=Gossypium mustelinum TaxID=34275 RepID=A0A5D2WCR7_GOSMU|nr:hypothetical protein E1A91_A13G014800v1 [Gossypium mustelinum]
MEILPQRSSLSSTLNPNASLFIPLAYRMVKDFSDQWWALVQSSPCFRDYWLQERFHDPENDGVSDDDDDPLFPDDLDDIFEQYDDVLLDPRPEEKEKKLVPFGTSKWRKDRVVTESRRFIEKAPKIVTVKVSPRTIHQPR